VTDTVDYYTCPCCKYRVSELQYTQANYNYECVGHRWFDGKPQRCIATISNYYPVFKKNDAKLLGVDYEWTL